MALIVLQDVLNYLQSAQDIIVPQAGKTALKPLVEYAINLVKEFVGSEIEQPATPYIEFYPQEASVGWFDGDELVAGYDLISGLAIPRERGDRSRAQLLLRQSPVTQIIEVRENPGAGGVGDTNFTNTALSFPDVTIVPPANYYLDVTSEGVCQTGILYRYSGVWSVTPRSIMVTYMAGLTPAQLSGRYSRYKMACVVAVAEWFVEATRTSRAAAGGGWLNTVSIRDFSVTYQQMQTRMLELPDSVKKMLGKDINLALYF